MDNDFVRDARDIESASKPDRSALQQECVFAEGALRRRSILSPSVVKVLATIFISLALLGFNCQKVKDTFSRTLDVFHGDTVRHGLDVTWCSHKDMTIRREWSTMPLADRVAFTDAVNCLYDSPSKLDSKIYPGSQNRFDDFVALHVNQTLAIHFSGLFLPWHRHFLHLWHSALKNECNYQGELPYWEWLKYAHQIYDNLLFDGRVGSMSGDGEYDPNNKGVEMPGGTLPIGKGGGCIKSGPFQGRMLNLGPYSFEILATDPPSLPNGTFDYNPRCLSRDINPELARLNHNESTVRNLLYESPTLAAFHENLSGGVPIGRIVNNPHAGGHFLYGGAGRDFFASNGDPVFYMHHSQIDRLWAKWQALDPKNRQYALDGTHTIFNRPPSPPVTVNDFLDMGFEDNGRTMIKDVMTRKGPLYCYRYDDEK